MHRRCQSQVVKSCRDGGAGVRERRSRGGPLARDLPETALRAASHCPTTRPSTAPLTSVVVWAHEVVRGVVNLPRIDGKDGVAGSIPAGGSTPNQQLRPGPTPGLFYARRARNAICQRFASGSLTVVVWTRSGVTILSGLRSSPLRCAQSAPVRCSLFDIDESERTLGALLSSE
jgi:hypothetical protein